MNNIVKYKIASCLVNRPRIANRRRDKFGTDSRLMLARPVPSRGGKANGTPIPSHELAWGPAPVPIPGLTSVGTPVGPAGVGSHGPVLPIPSRAGP